MVNLEYFKIKDNAHLEYKGQSYLNSILLKNIWDNGQRNIIGLKESLDKAALLEVNGWYHFLYNSEEDIAKLIKHLPVNPFPKFAALPLSLKKLVKEKWSTLDFIDHYIYEYKPSQKEFKSPVKIRPMKEEDLDYFFSNQPYIDEYGGKDYILHRIKSGFTACAEVDSKLVGWEIMQDDGTLGFLRVEDNYKRQGIGLALHHSLSQKIINSGYKSICHISVFNTSSIKLAEKMKMIKHGISSWVRFRTPLEIKRFREGYF